MMYRVKPGYTGYHHGKGPELRKWRRQHGISARQQKRMLKAQRRAQKAQAAGLPVLEKTRAAQLRDPAYLRQHFQSADVPRNLRSEPVAVPAGLDGAES